MYLSYQVSRSVHVCKLTEAVRVSQIILEGRE